MNKMDRSTFLRLAGLISATGFQAGNEESVFGKSEENAGLMPAFFIGHGSPMNAIEDNIFSRKWKTLGQDIPKPRAIISISAHWETAGTFITAMPNPSTIHDFGGFPEALYNVSYPAPGDPQLAARVSEAIKSTEAGPDLSWGLDHGTWSILGRMFPKADIPVIQLSLDYRKPPRFHYELGRELSAFRNQGVMIVGSGNMVHNLRLLDWSKINQPEFGFDWALYADSVFKKLISEGKHSDLIDYGKLGREVGMAIPTADHFLPMLYILGLQTNSDKLEYFNDKAIMGSLTMTSFKIG